jgi:hypothetical protein
MQEALCLALTYNRGLVYKSNTLSDAVIKTPSSYRLITAENGMWILSFTSVGHSTEQQRAMKHVPKPKANSCTKPIIRYYTRRRLVSPSSTPGPNDASALDGLSS